MHELCHNKGAKAAEGKARPNSRQRSQLGTQIRNTPVPGVHDTPNQCNALEYLSHVDTLASARPEEKHAMAAENKVQAQSAPRG